MKRAFVVPLLWVVIVVALPVWGQERLYPVRVNKNIPDILTSDRSAFVVEKAFSHKLIIGFPTDDRTVFSPDTRSPLVVLWLRIQNVSRNPLQVDISKFTSTDEDGRTYPGLAPDEAANRIIAGASGATIGSKTLRGISLGRAGDRPSEEELKEDVLRYSIQSGTIAAGAVKEGLIYFEAPQKKKFAVRVTLGDLWSQPLLFSTEKQK